MTPPQPPSDRTTGSPDVERFLAHRAWVRALALSLTRRAEDADDVEQETWLAAMRRRSDALVAPRAWFAIVARNAARKLRRGDARRLRRDAALPPPGTAPSASELTARAEAHRRVVAAVLSLDEPYREAVLLRHFEGLPVADAAVRAGVPLETLRARLRRARAVLRARLASDADLRVALGPLVAGDLSVPGGASGAGAFPPGPLLGGTIMGSKSLAVGAAVAVASAAAWWALRTPDAAPPDSGDVAAVEPAATAPGARTREVPPPTHRARSGSGGGAPVETPPTAVRDRTAAAPGTRKSAERLLDGIEPLEFRNAPLPEALGRLAEECGVRFVATRAVIDRVEAQHDTVSLSLESRRTGQELLTLLTRVNALAAHVEDDRVVIALPGEALGPDADLVEVARPAEPLATFVVRGRVRDAFGATQPGASVCRASDGHLLATTADDGTFTLRVRRPLPHVEARAEGRARSSALPVIVEDGLAQDLELAVGGAAGSVRVVVTSGGRPVEGASVEVGPREGTRETLPDGRTAVRPVRRVTTGADGRAVVGELPEGATPVHVSAKGHVSFSADTVVVAGGQSEVAADLAVPPPLAERLAAVRVSCTFDAARLSDVAAFLSRTSGVQVVLRPDAVPLAASSVTLAVRDAPLPDVLRSLCEQVPGLDVDVGTDGDVAWLVRRKE